MDKNMILHMLKNIRFEIDRIEDSLNEEEGYPPYPEELNPFTPEELNPSDPFDESVRTATVHVTQPLPSPVITGGLCEWVSRDDQKTMRWKFVCNQPKYNGNHYCEQHCKESLCAIFTLKET